MASPERILITSKKVKRARDRGFKVIVVVSAPGEVTDELLELASHISPRPASRELDMLLATGEQVSIALFAMALQARKVPAIALTGPQAGVIAANTRPQAKILSVKPKKILEGLRQGKVVVVAGFQGMNSKGELITLGRGSSDLTAVALAAALKARVCEIYTDVEGIFTADPRVEPTAKKIKRISYDEMLRLASSGAQVVQARAIEFAKRFKVPVHVKSSFNNGKGTWIVNLMDLTGIEPVTSSLRRKRSPS